MSIAIYSRFQLISFDCWRNLASALKSLLHSTACLNSWFCILVLILLLPLQELLWFDVCLAAKSAAEIGKDLYHVGTIGKKTVCCIGCWWLTVFVWIYFRSAACSVSKIFPDPLLAPFACSTIRRWDHMRCCFRQDLDQIYVPNGSIVVHDLFKDFNSKSVTICETVFSNFGGPRLCQIGEIQICICPPNHKSQLCDNSKDRMVYRTQATQAAFTSMFTQTSSS